jgi:FkbM family methyltransferase
MDSNTNKSIEGSTTRAINVKRLTLDADNEIAMQVRTSLSKIRKIGNKLSNMRLYDKRIEYQLQEIAILRKIVNSFSVDFIFDVGANQGQYARMLRKWVKFRGDIVSVEPNTDAFIILQRSFKRDKKLHAINSALGGKDGEQDLSVMVGHQFTSLSEPIISETSQLSHLNSVVKKVKVPVMTLKTLYFEQLHLAKFGRPFLKLDTQGYDAIITKSAEEILSNFVGVQTEVSFLRLYKDSLSFEETISLYRGLGFSLCAIVPNNDGHFPHLIEQDAIFLNRNML